MEVIRITGFKGQVELTSSKICKWTSNGRFFLEGDACTKNPSNGMRLENLGEFNQIRNCIGCYEMYTTPVYFNRDYSKFKFLYNKRIVADEKVQEILKTKKPHTFSVNLE